MAISAGWVNTLAQLAHDSAAGRTPSGIARHTPTAATSASSPTPPKAQRQPQVSPIKADSGMPSTDASDQPSSAKVIAWPRCAGGTITPSAAAACGVNNAADSTEMARTGSNAAKLGISADTPCQAPNHSS